MTNQTPAPRKPSAPKNLGAGGRALWRAVLDQHHPLAPMQLVQLTEACRMKDRLDEMDQIIQGKGVMHLMRFRLDDVAFTAEDDKKIIVTVKFDGIIDRANSTANAMKQLLAALRLPDEAGRVPQFRGPRGAQKPTVTGGADEQRPARVSSLERARQAKTGA